MITDQVEMGLNGHIESFAPWKKDGQVAHGLDRQATSSAISTSRFISIVQNAVSIDTGDVEPETVIKAIRSGEWREPVEVVRCGFQRVMRETNGNRKAAKLNIAADKKKLPAILWSGSFSRRAAEGLRCHSGLLVADLDELGERLAEVRTNLLKSRYLFALFRSPTGDGLKAVFRVPADAERHAQSWLAVQRHVKELTGVSIDEACKDLARLCFVSFDPDAYLNPNVLELAPIAEAEKSKLTSAASKSENQTRRRIAVDLLGQVRWTSDTQGYCTCPGKHQHTTSDGERDCEIHLDGAPTIHCFHNHCQGIRDALNRELRSWIETAEHFVKATGQADVRKSAATRLVQLADEFEFFHDPQDRPFVQLEINGHMEVWPVESSKFRKLLARTYYNCTGKAINRNALADATMTLAGRACHDSSEEPVFLRVAPHGENILIDLCDSQWRVVEVTPNGWQVIDKSPVAFVRTGSMQALPTPAYGGSLDPLWNLLNVTPAQRPLAAGALINYFHPHGPYFVLNFVGEQGTAKSCAARIIRQLVDPNENPLRSPPKEERDLFAQAASNRCVALDNLSSLPPWLSDSLCRLATGGGHSARTLYTNLEETSLAVKRPVILNGIEDVATRPDLAERVLQIELETIPDRQRISEEELWRRLDKQGPAIFSGLLDALACALRERPKVTLDSLPRMADAALWATAGEIAFGWKRGTFIAAYKQNLNEGATASVEAHPVGAAIGQLLEKQNEWSGEPAQLLQTLIALVSDAQRNAKNWPQNVRSLGHCLRRLAPSLRRAGIAYERSKGTHRTIHLCKAREKTSESSETPENLARKDDQDVSDDSSPAMHDLLVADALKLFNGAIAE